METNFAVIDLGSNTFHLLIVHPVLNGFREVYRERVFVGLGREAVSRISDEARHRALETLKKFKKALDQYEPVRCRAIGTEMFRQASNAGAFIEEVKQQTGITIEIISGQQEAEYIFEAVRRIFPRGDYLVMDIGGGSTEFVLYAGGRVRFLDSFPVGILALYERFPIGDPITEDEKQRIQAYLTDAMAPLLDEALVHYPVVDMIGAAGVINTYFAMTGTPKDTYLDTEALLEVLDQLIHTTYAERLQMPRIPMGRKKWIVMTSLFLAFVLRRTKVKRLLYSPNSLKEGVLYAMISQAKQ